MPCTRENLLVLIHQNCVQVYGHNIDRYLIATENIYSMYIIIYLYKNERSSDLLIIYVLVCTKVIVFWSGCTYSQRYFQVPSKG